MEKSPLFLVVFSGLLAVILLVGVVVLIPKEEDKPKVAVVLKTGSEQYWKMVEMGARKAFRDFGIDGEIVVAPLEYNEYEQQQLNMLKRALDKNPDALIVAPNELSAIPILEEYTKKNIPVLMVDTDIGWDKQKAFIGTDNSILGGKSAELLISMLQPGDEVVILGGSAYDPVVIERIKGAKDSFKAAGIKVSVEHYDIGGFESSKSVVETILETKPGIDGVFASNDEMALGALKAIEEKRRKIPVTGTDGIMDMLKLVKQEKVDAAIAQNTYDMGYISVEQALKAIEKKNVEKRIDVGIDIVTKENVQERMEFWDKILDKPD